MKWVGSHAGLGIWMKSRAVELGWPYISLSLLKIDVFFLYTWPVKMQVAALGDLLCH